MEEPFWTPVCSWEDNMGFQETERAVAQGIGVIREY
jgi:hypothetical protein